MAATSKATSAIVAVGELYTRSKAPRPQVGFQLAGEVAGVAAYTAQGVGGRGALPFQAQKAQSGMDAG
jgi:hypothetical protein